MKQIHVFKNSDCFEEKFKSLEEILISRVTCLQSSASGFETCNTMHNSVCNRKSYCEKMLDK